MVNPHLTGLGMVNPHLNRAICWGGLATYWPLTSSTPVRNHVSGCSVSGLFVLNGRQPAKRGSGSNSQDNRMSLRTRGMEAVQQNVFWLETRIRAGSEIPTSPQCIIPSPACPNLCQVLFQSQRLGSKGPWGDCEASLSTEYLHQKRSSLAAYSIILGKRRKQFGRQVGSRNHSTKVSASNSWSWNGDNRKKKMMLSILLAEPEALAELSCLAGKRRSCYKGIDSFWFWRVCFCFLLAGGEGLYCPFSILFLSRS